MGSYEKPREREAEVKPVRPKFCGVVGCQTHRDPKTKERMRGFADVLIELDGGEMVPRCAEHYLRDIYRAGHGRWSDIAVSDVLAKEDLDRYVPNPGWAAVGTKPERKQAGEPMHVSAALPELQRGAA